LLGQGWTAKDLATILTENEERRQGMMKVGQVVLNVCEAAAPRASEEAFARTLAGLLATILRRPIVVKAALGPTSATADGDDLSLQEFPSWEEFNKKFGGNLDKYKEMKGRHKMTFTGMPDGNVTIEPHKPKPPGK
jgi:hypothetical protein